MIKEAKNIDFLTTGRQLTEKDFALISEWIKKDKEKKTSGKSVGIALEYTEELKTELNKRLTAFKKKRKKISSAKSKKQVNKILQS